MLCLCVKKILWALEGDEIRNEKERQTDRQRKKEEKFELLLLASYVFMANCFV